jgi:hypothetical protein
MSVASACGAILSLLARTRLHHGATGPLFGAFNSIIFTPSANRDHLPNGRIWRKGSALCYKELFLAHSLLSFIDWFLTQPQTVEEGVATDACGSGKRQATARRNI